MITRRRVILRTYLLADLAGDARGEPRPRSDCSRNAAFERTGSLYREGSLPGANGDAQESTAPPVAFRAGPFWCLHQKPRPVEAERRTTRSQGLRGIRAYGRAGPFVALQIVTGLLPPSGEASPPPCRRLEIRRRRHFSRPPSRRKTLTLPPAEIKSHFRSDSLRFWSAYGEIRFGL